MTPQETIIFSFIAGGVGAFLGTYLQQKGKNLATREDISEITRKVESIKTDLAAKQHFSQVRYEREMKAFEEVWPKIYKLGEAALSLRLVVGYEGDTEESRKHRRDENDQKFVDALINFKTAIENTRPFYPPVIWEELQTLLKLCCGEAADFNAYLGERKDRDYWKRAENNSKAINEQIDKTCEAMRIRLNKFDSL
jgi:hypothetical protein